MRFDPEKHHRQSIRLRGFDYSAPGAYFVTIVAYGREPLFGEIVDGEMYRNEYGEVAAACWAEMPLHFSNVVGDMHIVMPNHVHGIVAIESTASPHLGPRTPCSIQIVPGSLPAIVRSYKAAVSRQINALRVNPAGSVWQRNYYEHIVREHGTLETIRRYIRDNPRSWATDPENPEREGGI